jgi:hypothetical protein
MNRRNGTMEGPMLQEKQQLEGCYCKIGEEYVGVYQSEDGPALFFDREVYCLNESCWDIEMVVGKNTRLFTFYWRGEAVRSLRFSSHIDVFDILYAMLPQRKWATTT